MTGRRIWNLLKALSCTELIQVQRTVLSHPKKLKIQMRGSVFYQIRTVERQEMVFNLVFTQRRIVLQAKQNVLKLTMRYLRESKYILQL